MRRALAQKIARRAVAEGDTPTEIAGLRLYRRSEPSACASAAYEPSLVVFVQGQKRISVGKTTYICDGSNFLLTSVDLPVVSQVIAATQAEPILGLLLKLEMPAVREILSQQEFHLREESAEARAMAVGVSSFELLDACSRLVDLLDTPAGHSLSRQPHPARDRLPPAAQPAGKASPRHRYAGRAEPSHRQGSRVAQNELRQAPAR
jgi:hypothetical protein